LVETAITLIDEHGTAAFSMAEASRRLGVAPSAPYRHFADRDALLAAVAVRAAGRLGELLGRPSASGSPEQRLAAAARLVSAIVATAHGHAMLMLDGTFGSGEQAADTAARQAATAALALITGREALM
jgi:AcrR family transcriptional regulator